MPPDQRRSQLLAAARGVFAARGYHQAGIADIVRAANCSRGTFYNHFESKREVFREVVTTMMSEVVSIIVPIDVSTPIVAQIRANLDRLVRVVAADDICRVLFSEAVGVDDEGDEALRDFYADAVARIQAALTHGQRLGVVRPGNQHLRARCLLGLFKEPVVQARLFQDEVDPTPLVMELLGLLGHGLLVDPTPQS